MSRTNRTDFKPARVLRDIRVGDIVEMPEWDSKSEDAVLQICVVESLGQRWARKNGEMGAGVDLVLIPSGERTTAWDRDIRIVGHIEEKEGQ